jgi:hypothetical protein
VRGCVCVKQQNRTELGGTAQKVAYPGRGGGDGRFLVPPPPPGLVPAFPGAGGDRSLEVPRPRVPRPAPRPRLGAARSPGEAGGSERRAPPRLAPLPSRPRPRPLPRPQRRGSACWWPAPALRSPRSATAWTVHPDPGPLPRDRPAASGPGEGPAPTMRGELWLLVLVLRGAARALSPQPRAGRTRRSGRTGWARAGADRLLSPRAGGQGKGLKAGGLGPHFLKALDSDAPTPPSSWKDPGRGVSVRLWALASKGAVEESWGPLVAPGKAKF